MRPAAAPASAARQDDGEAFDVADHVIGRQRQHDRVRAVALRDEARASENGGTGIARLGLEHDVRLAADRP